MNHRIPSAVESAKQARRSIGLIRRKLLKPSPEMIEGCGQHLRIAIECLGHIQDALGGAMPLDVVPRRALQVEVTELHRELAQVNALMRNASSFYAAWAQLLPVEESPAYTARGKLATVPESTLELQA